MIDGLKPYPAYKDSGLPWLGPVPAHWSVVRNGGLFGQRSQTGYSELPILEVSLKTGVQVRSFGTAKRKQIMSDLGKYKRAVKGDLAYNTMRMWQGALGVCPVDGLVSPAYVVARPYPGVEPRYFAALFRTGDYMAEIDSASRGIVKDRNRLYWDQFKQMLSPEPPAAEQLAIMRFLDWANGRVESAIKAKRRVISLLVEQRQAIIRRAVTCGLDSNVQFGATGIPWIGEVPKHWEVSRVKNEFHCLNTKRVPLNSVERGAMTARRYDYYGASGVIDRVDDYLFDDELLLVAEDGANLVLRNLPLAIIARGKFWVNNHAHILKPTRGSIVYLAHLLETLNYLPWISGAAQPKLTQDRLLSISIAVPPPEEQRAIVRHVTDQTAPLVAAIAHQRHQVELLREYRARLVADVVTGKLDVREVAATLPARAILPDEAGNDANSGEEREPADEEMAA
jgi:type I restriction enzyme S subunit